MKLFRQDGDRYVPVASSGLANEKELQELIAKDPTILPLELGQQHVVVREFPTAAGPADHLVVDDEARIVVVEAKLARNSTRRTVIAQAVDYAAQLAKIDVLTLVATIRTKLQKPGQPEVDFLAEWFQAAEQREGWLATMQANLVGGRLSIVILMDQVDDLLRDAVRFMNRATPLSLLVGKVSPMRVDSLQLLGLEVYGAETANEKLPGIRPPTSPLTDECFLAFKEQQSLGREGEAFLAALRRAEQAGYPVKRTPRTLILGSVSQDSLQWYAPASGPQVWAPLEKLQRLKESFSTNGSRWIERVKWYDLDPSRSYGLVADVDACGMGETDFIELFEWYAKTQGFGA